MTDLLLVNAAVLMAVGFALLLRSGALARYLGHQVETPAAFGPLAGSLLIGLALAAIFEAVRETGGQPGLGATGVGIVDLSLAIALAAHVTRYKAALSAQGRIVLWGGIILFTLLAFLALGSPPVV